MKKNAKQEAARQTRMRETNLIQEHEAKRVNGKGTLHVTVASCGCGWIVSGGHEVYGKAFAHGLSHKRAA